MLDELDSSTEINRTVHMDAFLTMRERKEGQTICGCAQTASGSL